ncbi:MAG: LytTR family DNA-binding domain-containing protein [Pseudoxanthomonas sp.]
MNPQPPSAYQCFLPWKRSFEVGFWLTITLMNGMFNSVTTVMDIHKAGLGFADWEPVVWEWSSALAWLALVWPIVRFSCRFPLHWDNWWRQLPWHLLASVAVSLLHVIGMVGLRELAYRHMGGDYDFGDWPKELLYEYLKDVRSFFTMVALMELYRLIVRRMQGEARLLGAPDEGSPVEPIDRPERFLVRKLGREFLVAAADIEWLQAAGNYVNLRVRGHDYPLRSTIAGIEAKLDPARFVRIHRSYIANLDQVASIEPLETGDSRVHMKDGTALPCSRTFRGDLRGRLGGEA